VSVQSLSGSGALRLGADLLAKFFPGSSVIIPEQTWGATGCRLPGARRMTRAHSARCPLCIVVCRRAANHRNIFNDARIPIKTYRYYNSKTITLDIDGMLADLEAAPPRSILLLHVCAHNPTGVDPTREQWAQILRVVKVRRPKPPWSPLSSVVPLTLAVARATLTRWMRVKAKQHFPFFDSAYQGFATGDLDGDAYSVRLFEAAGIECCVAQSFAKNMGLYGERTGCLHVVCASITAAEHVRSQVRRRSLV